MIIYDYPNYDKSGIILNHLNICAPELSSIMTYISEDAENKLVTLLNSIANQNIQNINSKGKFYTKDGELLSWDNLCSAERLFLISYFAREHKEYICIAAYIKVLSINTLRKFFREFYNCDYVDIMLPYEDQAGTNDLRCIMKEVING